jgi:hypothetical protein
MTGCLIRNSSLERSLTTRVVLSFYCPRLYYALEEERSNDTFSDYKAKSCYFLDYLEESPMSFVAKDVKSGKTLIRDSCVFDFLKMFWMQII